MSTDITKLIKVAELTLQRYESYLPTAYNSALTVLEKLNILLDHGNTLGEQYNSMIDFITEMVNQNDLDFDSLQKAFDDLKLWTENDGLVNAVNTKLGQYVSDGTFSNLINSDLLGNMTVYVSDDTVKNNVPVGKSYSIETLRRKQQVLLANAYKNIANNVSVKVSCLGDSTTYGRDVVSSDVRPPSNMVNPDGSVSTDTIASITYPEALQTYLTEVGLNITVSTRGFSGDTPQLAYNRWIDTSNANITLVSYGLNDLSDDLTVFRDAYINLISRELLRDSAVVLLTPFKTRSPKRSEVYTTNIIYELGKMFGIPVIEMDKLMDNYGYAIFSDDFHLNGTGYRMIGARLTSIFIGDAPNNPNFVSGGDKILTRFQTDNVIFMGGASYDSNGAMDTPDLIYSGLGFGAKLLDNNSRVYFSFYTTEDDLIILPDLFRSGTSNVEVKLDFDVVQPKLSLNQVQNAANGIGTNAIVTKLSLDNPVYRKDLTGLSDKRYIYVAKKGWHTLSIKKTVPDGTWWVRGLDVMSYDTYKTILRKGYYDISIGIGTTYTDVDIYDLCASLGITPIDSTDPNAYFYALALKCSVHSYNDSVTIYMIGMGNIQFATNWNLSSNSTLYNLTNTNGSTRPLTSITFDTTTKKLRFNWGGSTNKIAKAVIKVA